MLKSNWEKSVEAIELTDVLPELAEGKERAFRYVYEKYCPLLRFFISRYIPDKEGINDIVQEVFVKLWEVKNVFKDEKALKSYLYKTAKSLSLNQLRHARVEDKYIHITGQEEHYESFLENMLEAELLGLLNAAFEEIPDACKEVYILSLDGKKHEEIALELNLSVNSVKKYKNRANHFLKTRMKFLLRDSMG